MDGKRRYLNKLLLTLEEIETGRSQPLDANVSENQFHSQRLMESL